MTSKINYKSDFLVTLAQRGFLHQLSDESGLDDCLSTNSPLPAYIGFDATADSLHVGSLIQIMMLRHLQKTGHKPIILMGGGTTQIGDPSGTDKERILLDEQKIAHNIANIKQCFSRFIQFGDKPCDAIILNNADWLSKLEYIPFLREIGSHFSIGRMLSFDSVRLRLERQQSLSFLEFNYMILQAYDFLQLARHHDCRLQIGGSDQWGNIINGIELARRIENINLFALTSPLLTTASGAKMGKTASGAVWLSQKRLAPYDYWQFWRNTEDNDIAKFLKLFTELPLDEIAKLEALQGNEINEAKKILANEATRLCHGEEAMQKARTTAQQTFEEQCIGNDLPTLHIALERLEQGLGLLEALVATGLGQSNSEARRAVLQNGIKINDCVVSDPTKMLKLDDMKNNVIKLSLGKKKHTLISIS